MPGEDIHLSGSEWRIMQALWDASPRTLRQICDAVRGDSGWSKHAVISFLKRLQAKNAVRVEEREPARLYYPLIAEEEARAQEAQTVVDRAFRGSVAQMVSSAVNRQGVTEQDIEELMGILRRAKGGSGDERDT